MPSISHIRTIADYDAFTEVLGEYIERIVNQEAVSEKSALAYQSAENASNCGFHALTGVIDAYVAAKIAEVFVSLAPAAP